MVEETRLLRGPLFLYYINMQTLLVWGAKLRLCADITHKLALPLWHLVVHMHARPRRQSCCVKSMWWDLHLNYWWWASCEALRSRVAHLQLICILHNFDCALGPLGNRECLGLGNSPTLTSLRIDTTISHCYILSESTSAQGQDNE